MQQLFVAPLAFLMEIGDFLLVVAVLIYIVAQLSRAPRQIARGVWVVRSRTPFRAVFTARAQRDGDRKGTTWYITATDVQTEESITFTPLNTVPDHVLEGLTGAFGYVYATAQPADPIVVHSPQGVLVGKREAGADA